MELIVPHTPGIPYTSDPPDNSPSHSSQQKCSRHRHQQFCEAHNQEQGRGIVLRGALGVLGAINEEAQATP